MQESQSRDVKMRLVVSRLVIKNLSTVKTRHHTKKLFEISVVLL